MLATTAISWILILKEFNRYLCSFPEDRRPHNQNAAVHITIVTNTVDKVMLSRVMTVVIVVVGKNINGKTGKCNKMQGKFSL